MRTVGPAEVSLLVSGAGSGRGLRVGAVVSVEVLERLGPELYRIKAAGMVMSARASSLAPGSSFSARVERAGGGFVLRALPERGDSLQAIIARSGLPDDNLSRLAVAALLREGVAPEARSVLRVRRAGSSAEGRDEEEASERRTMAARLEAKGIAAEELVVDGISDLGSGARDRGGPGEQSGRRGRGGQEGGAARGESDDSALFAGRAADGLPIDLGRSFERRLEPKDLPRVLGALLRALSLNSGGEGDLLSLFNHLRGRDGSWVHIPFAFDLDSIAFSGGFRVKLPYIGGGPGRMEARFRSSRRGEESHREWRVDLRFGAAEGTRLRIDASDPKALTAAKRLFGAFTGELSALGCSVSLGGPGKDAEAGAEGLDLDA